MSLKKRLGLFIVLILAAALAYLLFAPVPITPAAWTPPAAPALTGQYEKNTRLSPVQKLSLGEGHNPEDVALDAEGKIYAGFEDGRIMVLQPDGTQPRVFANTGGRPLGLIFDRGGNLIVADAIKGLLSVNKAGEMKVLAAEADGVKFGCLNDLDIGADGTIYFTEASHKFPMTQHVNDLLEHQPNGRLLALDPQSQKPRTLLRDLYFRKRSRRESGSNVCAGCGNRQVSHSACLVERAEDGPERHFYRQPSWFPDGISSNGKDKFWLALVTPRQALFDQNAALSIRAQNSVALAKIPPTRPATLLIRPRPRSATAASSTTSKTTPPTATPKSPTSSNDNGTLYFGSIGEDTVGRFSLR